MRIRTWMAALAIGMSAWTAGGAGELSGWIAVEGRGFLNEPLYRGQDRDNASIAAQPEYYHAWENGSSFTFVPFGRADTADSRRTHADIRELNYLYRQDNWFVRMGVGKVFWGATEFVHLVDIINQTDLIEHIDGEDKLGQPMLEFSISPSWGTLDFFLMPYFRERTFPGRGGRLRTNRVVDLDDTIYESSSEERNIDVAARYSRTFGGLDFGVYVFRGTSRDPLLATPDLVPPELIDPEDVNDFKLIPFYEQINQFGTDVQYASGNWLWKLEAYFRNGYFQDYFAVTGGFEYTFVGLGGSNADMGLLCEYAYNDRDDGGQTIFQNDLFVGMRMTPNDAASTHLLMGFAQDTEKSENAFSIEASRRFGANWRLILEAWFFLDSADDSVIHELRDDDFARLELAYYF
ncbi:MAG: hypothetical protein GXY19_19360 [Phycisphaerae bacterium]|nr:hypothetical protein [Phycisphaerae bacterium]